jgi:hypothetical protein
VVAFGGGAVGRQACGGGAVGWDLAIGGAAVGCESAYGGVAVAHRRAVGGEAFARDVNRPEDRVELSAHPHVRGMKWFTGRAMALSVALLVVLVLANVAALNLLYRREPGG